MIDASGHPPIEIAAERARYSQKHVRNEYIQCLAFQTVYEDLVKISSNMFD